MALHNHTATHLQGAVRLEHGVCILPQSQPDTNKKSTTHPQDAVRLSGGVGEVAGQLVPRHVRRRVERKPADLVVARLRLQAWQPVKGEGGPGGQMLLERALLGG